MRTLPLVTSLAALAAAGAVQAAPPADVHVALGPKLQEKAAKTYGLPEVGQLAVELQRDVQRELDRSGAYPGARIELTLIDVKPNRPTFKEMGDRPGLSMMSFGVGGADIRGQIVAPDGAVTPVSYRWYETDIRQTPYKATWTDAGYVFDRFARRLAREQLLAYR